MNTQEKLAYIAESFETAKRHDDSMFTRIKADREAALGGMMLAIHEAVDGRWPDDWIYSKTADLADALSGYDDGIIEDAVCEVVDNAVDIYTHELTKWLASHAGNIDLIDEARDNGLLSEGSGVLHQISCGQFIALERIAYALIEWANDNLDGEE